MRSDTIIDIVLPKSDSLAFVIQKLFNNVLGPEDV